MRENDFSYKLEILDGVDGNNVTILNDDCISAMGRELTNDSVDLIITDPPYNLGIFMQDRAANLRRMRDNFFVDAGWDNVNYDEWVILMDHFFEQAARVIRYGGSMIVFMAIIKVETVKSLAEKHGFYYKTTGIWHKTNPMPRNMNLHFVNSVETWMYFVYKTRTGTFNNEGKCLHDFFESSVTPQSERHFGTHPTQKPIILLDHFVKILSNEGDVILDPFMGSGSTGVAAAQNRRSFIGIELNKQYYSFAQNRINEVLNEQ